MSIDKPIFYSRSEENLRKAQVELEHQIDIFAVKGAEVAEKLKNYRVRRTELLVEASKQGISATTSGDYIRGLCAQEKADYMKTLTEQQTAGYRIQAMETRMNNIRAINKGIEHQMKS